MKRALLFLNGEKGVVPLEHQYDMVLACDGGCRVARRNSVKPQIVIGDLDSLPQNLLDWLDHSLIIPYPEQKNLSDGELGVKYLLGCGFDLIDVVGAVGGRLDQSLTNLLLCSEHLGKAEFKLLTPLETGYFLGGLRSSIRLELDPGTLFSLVPLTQVRIGKCTGGKYPLERKRLFPGSSYTVSNQIKAGRLEIEVESGRLLLCVSRKRR
ncbi:MAG: thiamine diphosphokinase [Candidatus Wallbacteria bacterium]|nr:thiamine diphosphokinase [Candidatus Wallbacteria bacterium]